MEKAGADFSAYKKIGILGGTFNPIHTGHLLMAEYAREAVGLDIVILMPTGRSYLKAGTNVPDGQIRLEMVERCIEDNPGLLASDMEIRREGNTYTYETLLQWKSLCPEAELYFIVGADSLFSMEDWVKPEVIFANCTVLAAGREDASTEEMLVKKAELEERFGAKILLMNFPQIDISSTTIRERVRKGQSIRYLVHGKVREYILEHGLYRES